MVTKAKKQKIDTDSEENAEILLDEDDGMVDNISLDISKQESGASDESYDFEADLDAEIGDKNSDKGVQVSSKFPDKKEFKILIDLLKSKGKEKQKLVQINSFLELYLKHFDEKNDRKIGFDVLFKVIDTVVPNFIEKFTSNPHSASSAHLKKFLHTFVSHLIALLEVVDKEEFIKVLFGLLFQCVEYYKTNAKLCRQIIQLTFKKTESFLNLDSKKEIIAQLFAAQIIKKANVEVFAMRYLKELESDMHITAENKMAIFQYFDFLATEMCKYSQSCYFLASKLLKKLGLTLKSLNEKPTDDLQSKFYSWSTVLSFKTISAFAIKFHESDKQFQALLPTAIVLFSSAAVLSPNERFFPFRFKIVEILNQIQSETGKFIPTLQIMLSIFHVHDFNTAKPSKKSEQNSSTVCANLNFDLNTRLSASLAKHKQFDNEIIRAFIEQVKIHLTIWKSSLAFPELTLPLRTWIKRFAHKCENSDHRTKIIALMTKIEKHSAFIEKERSLLAIDLRNKIEIDDAERVLENKIKSPIF